MKFKDEQSMEPLKPSTDKKSHSRMARFLVAAIALLPACGNNTTAHKDVSVTGWDVTQEASVMTNAWVSHLNESSLPKDGRELRNVDDYPEQVGSICIARNDYGCTISMPIYDTFYDYESLDTVVARSCAQSPEFTEYPDFDVSRDQDCWDSAGPEEWLVPYAPKFIVRLALSSNGKTYTCPATVSEEMFRQTAQQRNGLEAKERGHCNIVSLSFPVAA